MRAIDIMKPLLGNIDALTGTSSDGKNDYVHPALRNLGSVSIVLVREIVAPAYFRNSESEITAINLPMGEKVVRAVPNKFKHREKGTGLKIVRRFQVGGGYPQNRTGASDRKPIGEIFDMNTLVFGDSVNRGQHVLPVKAGVSYSDGLGLVPYMSSVDQTTHVRSAEDGTNFDAAAKKNSNALYERYYVVPGALLVQVISASGRTLPMEGFEHLMLSVASSGTYGGQTSGTGVNVRTHVVGVYGSLVERAETSPYLIAGKLLSDGVDGNDLQAVMKAIDGFVAPAHELRVGHEEATAWKDELVHELSSGSERLSASYKGSHAKIARLFTEWFVGSKAA